MSQRLGISGTRAWTGALLHPVFFGMSGGILFLVLLAPLSWLAYVRSDTSIVYGGALGILFAFHIGRSFLSEQLLNDERPVSAPSLTALLSSEVMLRLRGNRSVTTKDLLAAAAFAPRGKFILDEIGMTPQQFIDRCAAEADERVDVRAFLELAAQRMKDYGESRIGANLLILALFETLPGCESLLQEHDVSAEEFAGLIHWEGFHHRFRAQDSSLSPEWLRATAIGRSWSTGYTLALDLLTQEMNDEIASSGEKSVVIHLPVLKSVLQVLSRPGQRNMLILGRVGVGKRTLVENALRTLRTAERENHAPFTRILVLRTEQLLSGMERPDTFFLRALQRAQSSGFIVLVIKDLAALLRSASSELLTILQQCLEARNIAVIGIADTADYHALVKPNPGLDSLFEKIAVEDCSDDEIMRVLLSRYYVHRELGKWPRVPFKVMRSIIELSRRFLPSQMGFPAVAVHVMNDAVVQARTKGLSAVREDEVREVISLKGKMNVQRMTGEERTRLLQLEDILKQKIIGQEAAVKAVTAALKRARLDLHERKKPLGTFLFLGPTGVGKTHTAKILAQEYFGSPDAMIRLDMNEYSHPDSVFGIIGSPTGGEKEGFLSQRVQDKPFSLILLDEIEKAHQTVLNLFLQILDEGMLTDARGVRTSFRNTIIIATSNAGALYIRDFVTSHPAFQAADLKNGLIETILRNKIFAPEFLNRFDDAIVFQPLTLVLAQDVARLMLNEIVEDIRRKRGVAVRVEPDAVTALVARGHSVEFGARELRRTITDSVEDFLADTMLRQDVKRGDTIVIHKSDLHL
jgi:ATP-dependent Clp protease ATP-binding subunit ClpC